MSVPSVNQLRFAAVDQDDPRPSRCWLNYGEVALGDDRSRRPRRPQALGGLGGIDDLIADLDQALS